MSTTSRQPQDPAAGSGPTLFRVGLTGGIGSGKSTVADRFVGCGAVLVDTDVIAHRLTAPGGPAIDAIRRQFGDDLIAADGSMARAAMRAHVFADPQARKTLESILHPMIRADSQREIAAAGAAGAAYVLLAIPLLVESGAAGNRVDRVLVVDCPVEVQIRRVMARSGLSREAVEAIMRSPGQPPAAARCSRRRHRQQRRCRTSGPAGLAPASRVPRARGIATGGRGRLRHAGFIIGRTIVQTI